MTFALPLLAAVALINLVLYAAARSLR